MDADYPAMGVNFARRNTHGGIRQDAGGTGTGIAVRVIRKSPDEVTPFGAGRILSETTMLDARIVDMPTPAPGDRIRIGPEDFILQGEPKLDRERLIWTLNTRTP